MVSPSNRFTEVAAIAMTALALTALCACGDDTASMNNAGANESTVFVAVNSLPGSD